MHDAHERKSPIGFRLAAVAIAALAICSALGAQQEGLLKEALEKKLAAVKESAAANKAALRKYTWTETLQLSLKGEVKSTKVMSCAYGANGQVVRTPVGPPPEQKKTGPLRGRIIEQKKEEMTDLMQSVKALIGLYVPPDSGRMQQAHQAGNLSFSRPAAGEAGLQFKNYAKPGDSMVLDFAMATKKLAALNVNSYLADPSQAVTLAVQFATLPDGTNYPASVVVNVPAQAVQVNITNANYQKLAGQ